MFHHGVDWNVVWQWRRPLAFAAIGSMLYTIAFFEPYYHHYHHNKFKVAEYNKEVHDLKVAYEVEYNPKLLKENRVKVKWDSINVASKIKGLIQE
ncbi:endonuclease MutS [Acrasis kona]|uniref:Endonuclease MutS n=1 Tax=Acrasis kona TaxID=1008807 RepID=A0AAW2YYH5_9EUKA